MSEIAQAQPANERSGAGAAVTRLGSIDEAVAWLHATKCAKLRSDSRLIEKGDAFLGLPGSKNSSEQHVEQAFERGAIACLIDPTDGAEAKVKNCNPHGKIAMLPELRARAGFIANDFYCKPSANLALVAITGTNGKTSTSWWLAQILSKLEQADSNSHAQSVKNALKQPRSAAVIGTLGAGAVPSLAPTGLTTPDAVWLHTALRDMAECATKYCAMEASSIGIDQGRLTGLHIDTAVLTNLTQDHLDHHGTMELYWAAKRSLFNWPGLRAAVINIDDLHGARLAAELQQSRGPNSLQLWTCSSQGQAATLTAHRAEQLRSGTRFEVIEGEESVFLTVASIGDFNVSNLLLCMAAARAQGFPLKAVAKACDELIPVPGRMECIGGDDQALVVVDYAHTPDALSQALDALRPIASLRGGRLWCVFGCGGNRDVTKRPMMGQIAERVADRVVITSDNPRNEDPISIALDIINGVARPNAVTQILNRATAIAWTIENASAEDVILIAGKGHEQSQEIAGIKHPFCDQAHARSALDHTEKLGRACI